MSVAQVRGSLWAIVPAAGRGSRFGGDVPKQYLTVAGKPLLEHALRALLAHPVVEGVVVALAAGDDGGIDGTEPRERLWRALTPQLFRRFQLTRALEAARAARLAVTDESMAMERQGHRPLLVEGREDNFKITTPADLALFEFILSQR